MKTSILKLVCGVFSIAFLFSSCLGDSDNKIEIGSDYAFITTMGSTYTQVAAVSGRGYGPMYLTSVEIAKLQPGECYLLGYRITNTSSGSTGYYTAEDIGAVPVKLNQTTGSYTAPTRTDDFAPTAFSIAYYDFGLLNANYSSFFGDRWICGIRTPLGEKDEVYAHFYYDLANQKEEVNGVMTDIGENKIIIDVRFERQKYGDGAETNKEVACVGNLSQIKSYFQSQSGKYNDKGEKNVLIPIKFRYNKTVTEGGQDVVKETLEGTWNVDNSAQYVFRYARE
ncbi:MAG: hypothetical protein LBU84_09190 [Prevotella sp.]|jgi:hypothetical protein|nr:hypothetical protein [Prevotella sp.]